uniref:uncharacterized protein LOC120326743 n=1 Tax=Styela clava TaxID=7725 RepID=UPI00193AA5E4|nr:uncharacterized protein LOC120326743 [Styela clava]
MHPMRKLLYHRGVDDHIGTYVTDYVYSGVCFLLCIQLIIRICRERRLMTSEQRMTSSCCKISNWLPWNWPKEKSTAINMTTYAMILFGFSNFVMMLLGGLTHQFLQTVEPYDGDANNLWDWLIVWRVGSSFSAITCLSLLIMIEQMFTEEEICRIPRIIRIIFYLIISAAVICFFGINYLPLTGMVEDPFSIRQSFIVTFGVVVVYGISMIIVVIRHSCHGCRKNSCSNSDDYDEKQSPSHSLESKSFSENNSKESKFPCCNVISGYAEEDDIRYRRLELAVKCIAPWTFVIAGATNHFLKSKCADSDNAYSELGCPLPDSFNHNALMHVIQIVSACLFFLGENIAITRRKCTYSTNIKRTVTSSTIYNDAMTSCEISSKPSQNESSNNNRGDDVVCKTSSGNTENKNMADTESKVKDSTPDPKFPLSLDSRIPVKDNRHSLYDNHFDV